MEEKEPTEYLIVSAQSGYGKAHKEVMNIVERFVNQSSSRSVSISNGWWFNFKKRNQGLSLRSGDSTAGVRMSAVNKDNINRYFDLLQEVFDEHNFSSHPEAIYNMDETEWLRQNHPEAAIRLTSSNCTPPTPNLLTSHLTFEVGTEKKTVD